MSGMAPFFTDVILARVFLIGMNAVIMDGAVIGDHAFVAALAFVKANFSVPSRSIVAGIPAKVVSEVSDEEFALETAW